MQLKDAISLIEPLVGDPSRGLPEEVFLFASRITPMVNVDLLIKDEVGRTLLTWRDDGYTRAGWHVPGGIIRFRERMADRILAVAKGELRADVKFDPVPLAVNELIHPQRAERGHFISLLFGCALLDGPAEALRFKGGVGGTPMPGQWMWHDGCPKEIIPVHEIYRRFIG